VYALCEFDHGIKYDKKKKKDESTKLFKDATEEVDCTDETVVDDVGCAAAYNGVGIDWSTPSVRKTKYEKIGTKNSRMNRNLVKLMTNVELITTFVGACPKTACATACKPYVSEIDEEDTIDSWLAAFKLNCKPPESQAISSESNSEEDENLNNSTLPDGQPKDGKGDSGISSMKVTSLLLLISLMIANFQF
jgi:hypothetical protein